MADSIFEIVAEELERRTDLAKLEARGTVRLALREGGLDAHTVTPDQMAVILRKVMPREMRTRGIEEPDSVCEAILRALDATHSGDTSAPAESPEAIFRRLAEG